jgi:hypothetical protein
MTEPSQFELTWRKTAVFVLTTLLASIILSIWMLSQRIYLAVSLFQYTGLFYILSGLAPALTVFVICAMKHPTGSRLWFVLLPLLGGLILCFYLALIGPALYSEIECRPPTYSGLAVHQVCICKVTPYSLGCTLDGLRILPFVRLTRN